MKFYTHVAGGLLLYVFLVWMFNQPFSIGGTLAVSCMSIVPDLLDRLVGEHRGWGHSAILLIPIILSFFISSWFGIALLSGFMAHILFDILTRKGVAFFYPFSSTRYVMPKKEKSRIITGSKQETALFIVVVLLLLPVSYGVIHGFPDLGSAFNANHTNNTTNKTNGTLSNLAKTATGDLRSSSSYPNASNSKTEIKLLPINTANNVTQDTEQDLIDWLDNNPIIEDNSSDTQNNTNNTSLTDVLFDDLSSNTHDLAAGDQQEQNMTMEDDSSSYVPDSYNGENPDADWNYDDNDEDDSGDPGFFFLIGSLISILGGAALVK